MYRLFVGWLGQAAKPTYNEYLIKRAFMSTTTQMTGQSAEKLTATPPVKGQAEEHNNEMFKKQQAASPDQLAVVAHELERHLPKFFNQPHPFDLYTENLYFINNMTTKKIIGLKQYAFHLALIKMYYNLRYTSVKVELLNLVKHPEESCVKIRWRVITRPGLIQFMLFFWKFHKMDRWTDAISTMHVNNQGKIYCHVCDNIDLETDERNEGGIKKAVKSRLVDGGVNV